MPEMALRSGKVVLAVVAIGAVVGALAYAGRLAGRRESQPQLASPETPRSPPGTIAGQTEAQSPAPQTDSLHTIEWFVDRAGESGLQFVHFNGMSGALYFPEIMGPGVGLLDFDNDGDLDVFLPQGQMLGAGKTLSDAMFPPKVAPKVVCA